MKNFVSPHVHIQSLDSASTPAAFAARELELNTGALVVTDHGSLAGCQTVYELARKKKLTPVLGIEGYFRDDKCPIFIAAGVPVNAQGSYVDYFKYAHFTCHFLDPAAYNTGIRLLSRAPVEQHGQETKPLFNWAAMEELGGANTTITTGCLIGMVQRHLLQNNDPAMARRYYERLRALVRPGHFFVEVFPHVCSHNWVQGVFISVAEEEGKEPIKLRFWAGKTLRTNVGQVKAEDLAKEWKSKNNKHVVLTAVKDYHTWTERAPAKIISVEHIEEFLPNECRPWCPEGDPQQGANRFMLDLAREYGDPVLISDDSHYAHPEEKVVQDVRLAQSGSWRFYGSYHRQSSGEAFEYFKHKLGISEKEFEGWVETSHAWAERFKGFKLEAQPDLPTKFYEALYPTVGVQNSLEYTMHLVELHGRMDWANQTYVQRLTQEINLLYRNGVIDLLPYFFIDEEVCRLYRDNKKLTGPGRGSAAGLLLTYLLGITHVDPIRYGLSLDRFLTVDRIKSGKLPDIDQDLPDRTLLVGEDGNTGWLKERFGDHVAQISTIMTLRLSSAVLDVARFTLGEVPRDIAALAHKFERPPQGLEDIKFVMGYEDSGNWVRGSIEFDPALQAYVQSYPTQWEVVKKCLGLGRSVSRHACAYVIANQPIGNFIPLTQIGGVTCTQFTAPSVEAAGGLKMDFLVINSLNDIAAAILMVQERAGVPIPPDGATLNKKWVPSIRLVPYKGELVDIWDLPSAQDVFAEVATGKTETVFQFNTPGAVQWLRHFGHKKQDGKYAIASVEDMSAFTALDRPGPLDAEVTHPEDPERKHNMLVEYARRARGLAPSPDIFVIFDKLFPETHGVMVYQEQLQRLYQEVTGCTGAEAEAFRGDVAKKKKEKIIAAYPKFIEGATKQLGSKESAEAVWQFIQSWAAYGFNKSHAVCYCVIAYACAFLKHNYPLEWWTAVLRNATKEEINEKFWRYCGPLIDLPDVTKAYENFTILNERIQAPLSLLDGVGPVASAELLAGAPFTSIRDMLEKIEQRKVDTTKPGKVTKKVEEVGPNGEKVKKTVEVDGIITGRSALHAGIVYRLLVSGAMDKLFSPGTTTLDMMHQYENEVWQLENEWRAARRPLLNGKKRPKKPKAAPEPVKKEYTNLDQYTRYQMRKDILPAHSEDVLDMLIERKHQNVFYDGRRYKYRWLRPVPFARAQDVEAIQASDGLPDEGVRVAVGAYVKGVRPFEYGPKDKSGKRLEPRQACELVLDVNGVHMKFVRWPDRETGELDQPFLDAIKGGIEGALAVVVLSKFKESKPFSVDSIEVVQPPLGAVPAPEEPEPEESKG